MTAVVDDDPVWVTVPDGEVRWVRCRSWCRLATADDVVAWSPNEVFTDDCH